METKNVAGRFERAHGRVTRNGFDATDVLKQARAGAMAIRDRLRRAGHDEWVVAVVASVEAEVVGGSLEDLYVKVLPADDLCKCILSRRVSLSKSKVDAMDRVITGEAPRQVAL